MSRQQTFAPDDLETHRQKRSQKKTKPWNLWYRLKSPPGVKFNFRNSWIRFGRYASYLIAKEAMERDQRKWNYRVTTEYRIMHDFEGKPE